MEQRINSYSNLGTPLYFYEVYLLLYEDSSLNWTEDNINSHFFNRCIDNRIIFDGCLYFGECIHFISRQDDNTYVLSKEFCYNLNYEDFKLKFIKHILRYIQEDKIYSTIFNDKTIKFDYEYKLYYIDSSIFQFKYANLKHLLQDFNILQIHPDKYLHAYIINPDYIKLYNQISVEYRKKLRRLTVIQLEQQLEEQKKNGEIAEKYVIQFEEERLKRKDVEWIARYITNEGYDIASYDNTEDEQLNRFIEVKSYNKNPHFYWTRNEREISRLLGDKYWIYLIDLSKIKYSSYEPMMIQNPFSSIIKNENWIQTTEIIKFEYFKEGESFTKH